MLFVFNFLRRLYLEEHKVGQTESSTLYSHLPFVDASLAWFVGLLFDGVATKYIEWEV